MSYLIKRICRIYIPGVILLVMCQFSLAYAKECNDDIPPQCINVTFLGEDDKSCACFVCNTGTTQRQVVCTSNPNNKDELFIKMRQN